MDKLRIPIAAVTESGVLVDAEFPVDALQPKDAEAVPAVSVKVRGTLRQVGEEYLFQGAISGLFEQACDRCLEPATQPFTADVLWNFKAGTLREAATDEDDAEIGDADLAEEELSTFPFEGNEIDLALQVWEELVLAVPVKYLCSPDCAGLCPHCGANLNRVTCMCPKDETMANKGLAGLADLLPLLKAKLPKE